MPIEEQPKCDRSEKVRAYRKSKTLIRESVFNPKRRYNNTA